MLGPEGHNFAMTTSLAHHPLIFFFLAPRGMCVPRGARFFIHENNLALNTQVNDSDIAA